MKEEDFSYKLTIRVVNGYLLEGDNKRDPILPVLQADCTEIHSIFLFGGGVAAISRDAFILTANHWIYYFDLESHNHKKVLLDSTQQVELSNHLANLKEYNGYYYKESLVDGPLFLAIITYHQTRHYLGIRAHLRELAQLGNFLYSLMFDQSESSMYVPESNSVLTKQVISEYDFKHSYDNSHRKFRPPETLINFTHN
ncbi:MAG: hypothetical protein HQL31_01300 [Planctomycetes bacterium]|nr:hypothetical protein [Planctomycetota bacterium]